MESLLQTTSKPTARYRVVEDGTGSHEGTAKSVQDATERDWKGPDGTKTTELQNRGLQVDLRIIVPMILRSACLTAARRVLPSLFANAPRNRAALCVKAR